MGSFKRENVETREHPVNLELETTPAKRGRAALHPKVIINAAKPWP